MFVSVKHTTFVRLYVCFHTLKPKTTFTFRTRHHGFNIPQKKYLKSCIFIGINIITKFDCLTVSEAGLILVSEIYKALMLTLEMLRN